MRPCLADEPVLRGIAFETQKPRPVESKGTRVDCGFRLALLVENLVVAGIKAIEETLPIHTAQVLTYLSLTGTKLGLLLNVNTRRLADGIKRVALNL